MFAVLFRDAETDGGRPVPWSIIAVWDTFAKAEFHAAMLRHAGFVRIASGLGACLEN